MKKLKKNQENQKTGVNIAQKTLCKIRYIDERHESIAAQGIDGKRNQKVMKNNKKGKN